MAKQFRLLWSTNKLYVSHEACSCLSEVAICHWSMTYFSYFKIFFFNRSIRLPQWITSEEHKDGCVSAGKPFPCQAYSWALWLPGNSLILTVPIFVTNSSADAKQVFIFHALSVVAEGSIPIPWKELQTNSLGGRTSRQLFTALLPFFSIWLLLFFPKAPDFKTCSRFLFTVAKVPGQQ